MTLRGAAFGKKCGCDKLPSYFGNLLEVVFLGSNNNNRKYYW